jgi:hypothetical protein
LFAYCCYATALTTEGGTGSVSFANKNVSGLQKYLRFQNEYNKVEIELRVVQFWTEIKLLITNRTPASRSCDFVITRLISVQIALHSVQLPVLIRNSLIIWPTNLSFKTLAVRSWPDIKHFSTALCRMQQVRFLSKGQ